MAAPKEILDLVERFDRNRDAYRSAQYNETQLRREFLDPFFTAFGWDVENRQGFAEAYKDVIHEDAIKVGGYTKAPDYCFRIGGTRKFFVEAKKPAVDIREDTSPAFQLRRYAWSAKLPLSILTDFEEFAVYDCRIKPAKTDKASTARIKLIPCNDYANRWDEIAEIFSRESVLKGAFDKYAETTRKKKGTAEVDDAFLSEIESWRDVLARNLALRNPKLSQRELNFAVQRTIDRIIFLRICEDRGIEPEGRLIGLTNGPGIYGRLLELYRQADDRYNSGLFHFRPEKGRAEDYDRLTPGLAIDDKVLKEIVRSLYYPDSPYEFSILPADILGQVYEQFLGKVIRLTAGHQAKVEDKPEVKKAGGVFYTPTYIVEYIVRNTVDKVLEGKTPKDAAKLAILDPACGSGSFLIGAFQRLLDWHRDWYVDNGKEKWAKGNAPALYQGPGGKWRLTTSKRKEILLNNIYGVDIDPQAVEVTKLSLLLKVLEGESDQTLTSQFFLFHKRALPDLGNNIKCGNSLIGPDFYENRQLSFLDEEERLRINVFDWEKEFPQIFRGPNPGFDAVVGNPPYVNAWELYASMPHVREFINSSASFATAERHWDLYVLFLERSLQVARQSGLVSFIIPYSYAIQKYGIASRGLVLRNYQIESIADLRTVRVFGKVPVITIIPVISKMNPKPRHSIEIYSPGQTATKHYPGQLRLSHSISQQLLLAQHENMLRIDLTDDRQTICEKLELTSIRMGDICLVNYGAQMSSREKGRFGKDYVLRDSPVSKTCKKTIAGRNLYRYSAKWDGKYVEWKLAPEMYGSREPAFFETPKLMVRDITGTHRLELALDISGLYCDHTILCGLRFVDAVQWKAVPNSSVEISRHFPLLLLLGLLASRVVSAYYYWKLTGEGVRTGGGFHTYPKTIRQLPVFDIRRATTAQRQSASTVEGLTGRMLDLHRKLDAARTPQESTVIQRQIEATDRQIDQLVYELYGLTDEEIRIVEESRT
ncbi:MAG: hypothetical protein A2W02_02955 [Alphaproteobacteria bacterium RBG_16_64_48]|jgi:hypothetical protein|nr:MAG: hypothetical protein A2W02_02955 [Alphaproteobacteria bacterium RBG_16_64_48]